MSLPIEALPKVGPGDRGALSAREDPLEPIVRAAGRGDRAAQEKLYARLAPVMLSVLRSMLGPASPDIADQLQESLVALMKALPGFRGESSVSHFACRIAMKRALDARRRAKTRNELPEAQAETLAMKAVLGYALTEIAEETRVPLNTVRSRLLLAKKALRERMLADATLRELAEVTS
jgi:DNA-directed RNA polymerase specialized sigma24 family protein